MIIDLYDLDRYLSVHEGISLDDLKSLAKDLEREIYVRERVHDTVCVICNNDFRYEGKNVLRSCCSRECAKRAYERYIALISKADLERREYIAVNLISSHVYQRSAWRSSDLIATADLIVYGGAT